MTTIMHTLIRGGLLALAVLLLVPSSAEAQGILKRARDAAKRGAERAVEREAEQRADRAVTGAIECTLGDTACAEEAKAEGREVVYVDDSGNPVDPSASGDASVTASGAAAGGIALRPGEGAWANYDFVPGERPLFVDDFSGDRVGNFPRRLEFAEGNMEVVDWEGQRFLRATARSAFRIPLPEALPERFTIEFDVYKTGESQAEWITVMTSPEGMEEQPMNYGGFPGSYFLIENGAVSLAGQGPETRTETKRISEALVPVRIAVDGNYAKMYMGEQRVVNVPNAKMLRGDKVHVILWFATPEHPVYVGNIRVMAGGRELYDALAAEGRVATQGILFDSGSDVIRPESTPTLEEIGDMLKDHADLRLAIEGHTDDQGDDAVNQSLSERRAAAVKAYLVQAYGIDASRLDAQGYGESKPAADNATPEGRQQNRRVELVRL